MKLFLILNEVLKYYRKKIKVKESNCLIKIVTDIGKKLYHMFSYLETQKMLFATSVL